MTDKLRKYVLPNIPYVFIGWVFLKLGTAYRLAAGGDFAHKLLGLGQTHDFIALYMTYLHVGIKFAGTDTHECNTVSVSLVHISLNLKYKG